MLSSLLSHMLMRFRHELIKCWLWWSDEAWWWSVEHLIASIFQNYFITTLSTQRLMLHHRYFFQENNRLTLHHYYFFTEIHRLTLHHCYFLKLLCPPLVIWKGDLGECREIYQLILESYRIRLVLVIDVIVFCEL